MSSKLPSLTALLGLVAVAGYQNRDKLGELFKSVTGGQQGETPAAAPSGGLLGSLTGALGGMMGGGNNTASAGSVGGLASMLGGASLAGGLGELVSQLSSKGLGNAAQSWVGTGANEPVSESQLSSALGPDLIDSIAQQTGLSREELLQRLAAVLPEAVDKMTPGGRLPS